MNFINSILALFNKSYHTIKKDDVITMLENIITNYETNVLPSIDMLIGAKDLKGIKDSGIIVTLAVACGMQQKDAKNVLDKLKYGFESIVKNKRVLLTLVEKELSPVSTDRAIRAKDAGIIRVISDLGSMGLYALDIFNIILIGKEETTLPPIRVKEIINNIPTFGELFKAYGDPKNFNKLLEDLKDVTTTTLDVSKNDAAVLGYALGSEKTVPLPTAHGFIGNPFYHISMILVDRQIKRFEELKLKRELIALRILELKQKAEGAPTDQITAQIAYYENELADIEYNIAKIQGGH